LQAAIKKQFGITANLKEGHSGIFTVAIDGKIVYDNRVTHRFPENVEISEKIRALKK
jgi:predicted Rdx family selenoprotein